MKEIERAITDIEMLRADGKCIQPNKSLKMALAALNTMKHIFSIKERVFSVSDQTHFSVLQDKFNSFLGDK